MIWTWIFWNRLPTGVTLYHYCMIFQHFVVKNNLQSSDTFSCSTEILRRLSFQSFQDITTWSALLPKTHIGFFAFAKTRKKATVAAMSLYPNILARFLSNTVLEALRSCKSRFPTTGTRLLGDTPFKGLDEPSYIDFPWTFFLDSFRLRS